MKGEKVLKKSVFILITIAIITALLTVYPARAYTDSGNRFSITPPQGWTAEEGVQGTVVQFLGPQDSDVAYVNINIDIQNTDQMLQTIIDNSKQSWASTYSNYSLTTDQDVTVNGHSGHELAIYASDNSSQFMQDSVLFVQNGLLYQVTYIAGPTTYDAYYNNWISCLDTFQILFTASPSPSSSSDGFNFSFSITGLPFLLLFVAVIIIIIVIVVAVVRMRKPKNVPLQTFPPPPP
jgi:hypothetical protein